jgi:tRNA-splicing ligase RtcB
MAKITGKDLIEWGFKPGKSFKEILAYANKRKSEGVAYETIRKEIPDFQKTIETVLLEKRKEPLVWEEMIDVSTEEEESNLDAVREAMSVALSLPVVRGGVVLPDACPAGFAPVGSVIVSEAIHPAFHSSDVCCSVACTSFDVKGNIDAAKLTDVAKEKTHFGIGSNKHVSDLRRSIINDEFPTDNPFLAGLKARACNDIGTQGDGNHFLFIGRQQSTGLLCLVTHHGSRSLGAQVYKRAVQMAQRETSQIASGMGKLGWFSANSELGQYYWEALQYIRQWTKINHMTIHDLVSDGWRDENDLSSEEFFWNEHNFVFKKDDGLFYHAKGATPNYKGFSEDDSGKTLVPLNMGEPILVLGHSDNEKSKGFAPHGAGRNLSRTKYLKGTSDHTYPEGVEVRFYTGNPDLSELPNAYKNPEYIRSSIKQFSIGEVIDTIEPIGSVMAGHVEWGKGRKKEKVTRNDKSPSE